MSSDLDAPRAETGEESIHRKGVDDNITLDQGDTMRTEKRPSELHRGERTPGQEDRRSSNSSQLHDYSAANTADLRDGNIPSNRASARENSHDGNDHEDAQDDDEEGPRDNSKEGKPVLTSTAVDAQDIVEALILTVTVARAEGLSVSAPRHTFRMPKNNPTQRRYVRLSVLDNADGRTVLASAVTSAVAGNKPECGWGGDERGETLHLVVDKAGQGTNNGGEEMPLQWSKNKKTVLEVEAWSNKNETGGVDILLGRGQTLVAHTGVLESSESEARWVVLSLDDKPKGKIEIYVSTSISTSQLEARGEEVDLEQDGPKEPVSDGEISKRDDDDERELSASSEDGSEGNTNRKRSIAAERSTDAPEQSLPKARATKWGLPSMPDLKSTLNASLVRATNMIAKQPDASINSERGAESEDGASKEGTIAEGIPEGDGEWQSVIGDETDRQAISKTASLEKTASHGMPKMLGARHGMLSLKESLQARLTGTSGKLRTEHDSGQTEGTAEEQSEGDGGAHHESGAGQPPANNDNTPDQGQGASAITLPGRQARDIMEKQADLENLFSDVNNSRSLPAGTPERKQTSRESSRKGSLGEGGRGAERRQNRSRADSLSPLRSLLQDVTADQAGRDASSSQEEQQPQEAGEEEVEDGEGKGDHERVGNNPTGSGLTKWSPAHSLSVPVVASSVKEAAAKVKSSLSSPKFSGSLKSFRWNRHKEDSFTNDPSPQRASTDDTANNIAPTTPTCALGVDKTENDEKEGGSLGSGSSPSPPMAAAAILVSIFRACDLPEILAKRKFGRTKKDGAQDPYVLLKLHDCEAVTSTAQREGQEWTWGNGDEGEVVEIPIPVSKIPNAGLESSNLIVEVRNKATDVREKDALLSSTEISLIDFLGRKAIWVDLEVTGSPGGRVQLSVALTERGATSTVPKLGSHKDTMDGVSDKTSATTKIVAIENYHIIGAHSITSTTTHNDVRSALQDLEQDPQPSVGDHGGMAVIAERDPEASSVDGTPRGSSETDKGIRGSRESKAGASRRNLGSLPSDENSRKAVDRKENGPHPTSGALQGQPETGDEVVSPQEGASSEAAAVTSSHDVRPKQYVDEAFPPTTDVMEAADDRGGDVARVDSAVADDNVSITVRVQEADSLAISLSKNAFGRPKKNATQDPYVVLRMCSCREATSAVVKGGSKCQWPGTAGEAVCLAVSSADLMSAGWGQAEAEGPRLTVEVWNQESPNRQGDIFIGSADVRLKDHLGSGPSWVDIRRRRNSRGRVLIDVSCPILQQSVSDTNQAVDVKTKRPSVEENLQKVIERVEDTRRRSSELVEGGEGGAEEQANQPGQAEQTEEQDDVSNLEGETKDHEPVRRSSQVTSGKYDKDDKDDRPIQEGGENTRLSDASVEAFNQGTAIDSSPSRADPADSLETPVLPRKEHQNKTQNAQEAGIGDDIEKKSNVPTADVTDLHAPANSQSARFSQEVENDKTEKNVNESTAGSADSHVVTSAKNVRPPPEVEKKDADGDIRGLSRQPVIGTATDLDLTASGPISDPQASPTTKQESTRVDSLTTNVTSVREHSESESTKSIQPGSEYIYQPSRFGDHQCGDGSEHALDEDQISRSKSLKASDGSHSDGALSGGLNEISDDCLQTSKPEAPHDPRSSAQPSTIKNFEEISTQQKLAKKLGATAINHSPAYAVTQAQTEKRLVRAREIARLRRRMTPVCEPVGGRGRINAQPGVQATDSFAVVTPEQARAVTTIQGACRGRAARRRLRARQRAAISIQAVCRGYVSRRECTGLRARTKRANAEEKRSRERRLRMAATQKELNLLRRTPTPDLARIFALRTERMVVRIQRFWRQYGGETSVWGGGGEVSDGQYVRHSSSGAKDRLPDVGTERQTITAPKIKSFRSDRSTPSNMTLEALRLRVETRQRARGHCRDQGSGGNLLAPGTCEAFGEAKRERIANGTIDSTYESLMAWQEEVSRLTGAVSLSELERVAAAKRRSHRLTNFRRLQDQLLHPPKLNSTDKNGPSAWQVGDAALDASRRQCMLSEGATKDWSLAEQPAQRDRAQRAHVLAVAAAKVEGSKPWATSLPADVGFGQIVDIRRVLPSWSTKSANRSSRRAQTDYRDYGDGYASGGGTGAGGHSFSSDEASLWWYTYACTGKGGEAGVPKRDHAFPELLERVKMNLTQRREHVEREEHKHRLTVARKRLNIVQKVIHQQHQQQVANHPSPLYSLRRVTEAQRIAAVVLQACARGFLQRKKVAVLRAEMRLFSALQVLVNELRQPELDEVSIADPMHSLAGILAEHTRKAKDDVGGTVSESMQVVARCGGRAPTAMLTRPRSGLVPNNSFVP